MKPCGRLSTPVLVALWDGDTQSCGWVAVAHDRRWTWDGGFRRRIAAQHAPADAPGDDTSEAPSELSA
ncbi:hypothetical protein GCM10010199_29930 [Dactylosporangium roseum]